MPDLEYTVSIPTDGARRQLDELRRAMSNVPPVAERTRAQMAQLEQSVNGRRLRLPPVDLGIFSERLGLAQQAMQKLRGASGQVRVVADTARARGPIAGVQAAMEKLNTLGGRIVLGAVTTRFMGPLAGATAALGGVRALASKIVVDAITGPIIARLRPVNVQLDGLRSRAKIIIDGTAAKLISVFPSAEARIRLLRRRAKIQLDATLDRFNARMPQVNAALTKVRNFAAKIALGFVVGKAVDALMSVGQRVLGLRRQVEQPMHLRVAGGASGMGQMGAGGAGIFNRFRTAVTGGLGAMAGAATGILAPLAAAAVGFYGVHTALGAMHQSVVEASNMEQLEVGLTTMLRSGEKAKALLVSMQRLADSTPLTMPQVADAGRKLLAFGTSAKDVMGEIQRLGDVASGIQMPLGELTEIYGKAQVQGRLFAEDINQFQGRGIPIVGALAKQLGVAETQIRAMVEAGQIGFPQLQRAFMNLTGAGGMFQGMLAAQGQTALGKLSTFQDAVSALYREFGKPLLAPIKTALDYGSNKLGEMQGKAREWGARLGAALQGGLALLQGGDLGSSLGLGLKIALGEGVNILYRGASGVSAVLATGLGNAADAFVHSLMDSKIWDAAKHGLDAAGYSLAAIIQHKVAETLRAIPGMSKFAAVADLMGNVSERQSGGAAALALQSARGIDIKSAIAKSLEAGGAQIRKVFDAAYAGAGDALDQTDNKTALGGILARTNARLHPAPAPNIQYDNEGLPSGPDAPWYAPGSTRLVDVSYGGMLGAGRRAVSPLRPQTPDLSALARSVFSVPQIAPPVVPDLGPGLIGGRMAGLVLGAPRQVSMPNLNAGGAAAIGGSGGLASRDPSNASTAKNTEALVTQTKELIAAIRSLGALGGRF